MYRKLFYGLNFGLLAVFLAALAMDYATEWRHYQREYYRRTAAYLEERASKAKDPAEAETLKADAALARAQSMPWAGQINQIIARDLGRVDRCTTCHVGMDEFSNPAMTTPFKDNPFKGHPDVPGLVKSHPFQKFGCTSCHAGQGLATEVAAAHGNVHFWEKPLLEGKLIESSCAKCHGNFETLRGAETAALGKRLFDTHGCRGCHSINGVGGIISVDLGEVADKPLERIAPYNFSLIKDKDGKPLPPHKWKLPYWIMGHLTNVPMDFIPNDPHAKFNKEPIAPSGMPDFTKELPEGGAEAIAAYLLSMTKEETIPARFFVAGVPKPEPKFQSASLHGKFVFEKYGCAGCHGLHGAQGRRNFNATGPDQNDPEKDMDKGREPTLTKTVGTYTREELVKKVQNGVPSSAIVKFNPEGPTPPLYMPPWKEKIQGQELEDLATYLMSIADKSKDDF